MRELHDLAVEMMALSIEERLMSKVDGAKRYAVKVSHQSHMAVAGAYGMMKRRNFLTASVKDITKNDIRWYTFSYKKDFLETVHRLEENGYTVFELH